MKLKLWIGLLITVLIVWLIFREVKNWSGTTEVLKSVNLWFLIPIVFLIIFSFIIRALRWQYFLCPLKKIDLHSLFSVIMIGFMANNLLPARLGEIVRAYIISRKERISVISSFATIVIERIFDLGSVFFLLGLILISTPFAKNYKEGSLFIRYTLFIVYITSIIFISLLIFKTEKTLIVINKILFLIPLKWKERINQYIILFVDGLKVLNKTRDLVIISFLSIFMWFTFIFSTYLILLSLPNFQNPHWSVPFTIIVFTAIGIGIPSSPGFIGVVQASCILALKLYNYSTEEALGFSIVYHIIQFIPVTVIGLIYLKKEKLSLDDLTKMNVNRKL